LRLAELFKNETKTNARIVVVGAGSTGVELAGELQSFARKIARKYRKHVAHPDITIIEGADRVLPMLDPVLSAKAYKQLHKLGVKTQLNTKVNSCEAGKVCLDSGDISADVFVWTAGSRISDFFANNPRVFKLERGRVKVDLHLLADGHDDIYVIGDNACTPYSGMAQTALHDAKFVANDILARHRNKAGPAYRAWHPVYVVPVGANWAVLQTTKRKVSGYLGWLARRRADMWIFRNFLPYKQAVKHWRRGNRTADF
jgi:NADH dehydrogenase